MTREDVLQTYNKPYAETYDSRFLLDIWPEKTEFELSLINEIQRRGSLLSWLDVACGTGYFLEHVTPDIESRTGLDLSPSMLEVAGARLPDDVRLIQGDYLEFESVDGEYDLVTSLWLAYGLQENMDMIRMLIHNLYQWTKPGGVCMMPVLDPQYLVDQPDGLVDGMSVDKEDGTVWSFREPDGSFHRNVLAPKVGDIVDEFRNHFDSVQAINYPDTTHCGQVAIVAT